MATRTYVSHMRVLPPMLVALLLAGCAVQTPPEIRSSRGEAASFSSVHLVASDPANTQRSAFYEALKAELTAQGLTVSDTAPMVTDYALASSAADLELYASEAGKTEDPPEQIADARKPHWTDRCKAARTRATLSVFERATGTLRKSSIAHATGCADQAPPFDELAKLLVADVLAD
ncbi:hypothetical protein ACRAQ7_03620 [Erythrobacter sp. W53]|uniref:hypothetical protein n=1 Tax=Erythrobacter sp. W53 TaxID=3425947 RepID=UPI003D769DF0